MNSITTGRKRHCFLKRSMNVAIDLFRTNEEPCCLQRGSSIISGRNRCKGGRNV